MSCPDCFRGHDHPGPTTGIETKMYGLDVYVSNPPESASGEINGLIIIISDAFGWATNNLRRLADSYAKRTGWTAAPAWSKPVMDRILNDYSIWGCFAKPWHFLQALYAFIPFTMRNHPPKRYPSMVHFFSELRSHQPSHMRIGAAGFCWGAYGVTRLARAEDLAPSGQPLLDVAYTAHPSEVEPAHFENVKIPYSLVIGDVDFALPKEQVELVAITLEQNQDLPSEVVVIPNAKHGFAVRGNPNDPIEKEMADQAEEQLIRWFKLYL
ncbi:hypothetical protein BU24DRAFT_474740 [Aaosphaeria arxii CBS 175.79]|uniref:Dienelactone hydrolase domain-containing protein n=1 Tax=Aaosphaeria arxii CBS 175.79 TaxID=1450172 RepID=A0A6A5X780_9PLEO|nr:uncharacterized protein BU24DRAFT_474740 [Aaosphaeria arxii CBS 175.79]KAF2008789.1 hypothetical protein BU24DRAFT_474740 [Aaosphaeria arxii CBS 175.79]